MSDELNVIRLRTRTTPDEAEDQRDLDTLGAKTERWKPGICDHARHAASVSDRERRVYCSGCNVELDPIDVLTRFAQDSQNIVSRRRRLHREIDGLTHRLGELQRDERNTKSRLRTAKKRLLAATVDLSARTGFGTDELDRQFGTEDEAA